MYDCDWEKEREVEGGGGRGGGGREGGGANGRREEGIALNAHYIHVHQYHMTLVHVQESIPQLTVCIYVYLHVNVCMNILHMCVT